MAQILIVTVFLTTTITAYVLMRGLRGYKSRSFREAFQITLECIGTCVAFLIVNVGLSVALVLLVRGITPWFISLYSAADTLLVGLSILQGFVFQIWWRSLEHA
jgi:hypothetical protein